MTPLLKDNNYVYVPGFITPEHAKILATNYERFCQDNKLGGDEQIPTSNSSYNFIDFLELLCNSTREVGEFIGENVLPTYTYSRIYRKGSELIKHKDRDACEISLTVHLDGDRDWPIFIENPKGETVSLNLKSGDAMLYLGCEAEHWREMYEGDRYVQVFLHYVRSRGDKSYSYFDKSQQKTLKYSSPDSPAQIDVDDNKVLPNLPTHIPRSKSSLQDFIHVFDNIIPHDLCDDIIQEFAADPNLVYASVGGGDINRNIRNVNSIFMSDPVILQQNLEMRRRLDQRIYDCMGVAIRSYNTIHDTVNIVEDTGYQFLKYDVGNFYVQHTDNYKDNPRSISCSIALNDDYEGGEFAFFDRDITYKIKKGSVIMFPSSFMYPHEILPVTSGTRFAIITWFL